MRDMEYEEIRDRLSVVMEPTQSLISRRNVLKAIAAGVGVSMIPSWMIEQARMAQAVGPSDGILVIVQLGGGNDGLNTVVPTDNAAYYQARGGLAVKQGTALPIATGVGLHPSLPRLQKQFQSGKVAIVQGVGYPKPDMSHFASMATWMAGSANGVSSTGWLGRYLDGMAGAGASAAMSGVSIGASLPFYLHGMKSAALSLPNDKGGLFGVRGPDEDPTDLSSTRVFNGVKSYGAGATALQYRAGAVAKANTEAMELGNQVAPCYPKTEGDNGKMAAQMQVAANLINANLGVRVIGLEMGSFDTHSGQDWQHKALLDDLDLGIENFFSLLNPALAPKVTMMTFSEFGRRVQTDGGGTDHGTAGPMFVIGNGVKGGIVGEQPSLTNLDQSGNLVASIDFHSVYGTVLDNWLGADSGEILGRKFETLPLFGATTTAATAQVKAASAVQKAPNL